MTKLIKYTPNYVEYGGKIMNFNQLGRIEIVQAKKWIDTTPKYPWQTSYIDTVNGYLKLIDKWYIQLQAKDNHFNNQFYFNTKEEAEKELKKIKKYLKVKKI